MLSPVKNVSIPFTSDGTATAMIVDLNNLGLDLGYLGQTNGVTTPAITASSGPAVGAPAITIAGSILTMTLGAALPTEYLGNLVIYTLTFLLELGSLSVPA
jgi:hypothetical protein